MRLLSFLVAVVLFAQEAPKPPLENAGRPMKLTAVCGDDEIREFGFVCTEEEPCPVYLELSGVDSVEDKIFVAGNFHTESATLSSILLGSADDGKTWNEVHSRVRGAVLDMVQFADASAGWASGELAGSVARDPFFLRTIDGGKTWRRIPVFEDSGTAGVVDQFWFDSPTQGVMLLDKGRGAGRGGRYQRLETASGGDVWSVREAGPKPFQGKYPKTATSRNPNWRVRTDAAAKAFRVEKRQGAKWSVAASFAVAAGGCKPAPPKPAEPPQEPEAPPVKEPPPE